MKEQARPRKKRKRALRGVIAKYEDVGGGEEVDPACLDT